MNDFDNINNFEADKYMRTLGAGNLVMDVEMKLSYLEDKAFRVAAMSVLISLLVIVFNFFW